MRRRIAVDMTPLGPAGQTGGSGVVATSLIRQVSRLGPDWELVLLTSSDSHDELAELDAPNVRRVRVIHEAPSNTMQSLARQLARGLPTRLRVRAKDTAWRVRHRAPVVESDLMLCPFTSSNFWQPSQPLVVIVHDLQHVAFPQFFSEEKRLNRDQHLRDAAEHADAIVCVSDFVRQTLLSELSVDQARVVTIHHGLLQPFDANAGTPGTYLLYPANFWPHKNHHVLLESFVAYRRQRPGGLPKLVCTGASSPAMHKLRESAKATLAPRSVEFRGYVSKEEFVSLMDNCAALIYPSLYEGFGMPVLEAMARGKPVLCSRIPALEEVAGDAAHYFDPNNCEDIVRAIISLDDDRVGTARRVACGRSRSLQFGDAASMARSYIGLFERILTKK